MSRILILAIALALSACATPPSSLEAGARSNVAGFATLAVWGEWESDLAPAYTRLAVVRHRAARLLTDGRIGVDTAIAVQKSADEARALLDQSRRGNAKAPTAQQRDQLAAAQRLIAVAESHLER